jgi:hypothetical protein
MNIQADITTLIWMIHQSFCLGHPLFTAQVFQCLMFPGYKHVSITADLGQTSKWHRFYGLYMVQYKLATSTVYEIQKLYTT